VFGEAGVDVAGSCFLGVSRYLKRIIYLVRELTQGPQPTGLRFSPKTSINVTKLARISPGSIHQEVATDRVNY
jgi:hypothetical protein